MARKQEPRHEKDNTERWLLTYADMITLLLAVFVVMYSMSVVDAQKFDAVSQAMMQAIGIVVDQPIDSENPPDVVYDFGYLYDQLMESVADNGYIESITVKKEDNSIIMRFKDSVLFYPDQAVILPEGQNVLRNISSVIHNLEDLIGHIQIEGHTANIYNTPESELNSTSTSWGGWQLWIWRSHACCRKT